jgi:hypothetical protein
MLKPSRLVAALCLVALLLALVVPLGWDASWGALLPASVAIVASAQPAAPAQLLRGVAPASPPLRQPSSRGPPLPARG